MKAEIGVDAGGGFVLVVTPESPTESAMLKHVAPLLGLSMSPYEGEATLSRPRPTVVSAADCDLPAPKG